MRETEFWERMDAALGSDYARFWAGQTVVRALDGLTPAQALAAGESPKTVWRAVWEMLDLPARDR